MTPEKVNIVAQLRKDMLSRQGFTPSLSNKELDARIGVIKHAFAQHTFPVSAIHEFICCVEESEAATAGFIAALLSPLMQHGRKVIWVGPESVFPPALKFFGVEPGSIIFITARKQTEILWAMEESLRCQSVAAVVAKIQNLDFTTSRRLQLAVEQSHVTGFVLRNNPKNMNITACVTRWKINSIPSELEEGMPGVGFPRWNIELLKVRNGKPGTWQMEFTGKRLMEFLPVVQVPIEHKKAV